MQASRAHTCPAAAGVAFRRFRDKQAGYARGDRTNPYLPQPNHWANGSRSRSAAQAAGVLLGRHSAEVRFGVMATPEFVRLAGVRQVEAFCKQRVPALVYDPVRLACSARGNAITIVE